MNNVSDLFRGIGNIIRDAKYIRLISFVVILIVATIEKFYPGTIDSALADITQIIALIGTIKSFLPSNTAKLPNGEVVSTLKSE